MTLNTTYKPAVAQGNGIIKEFSYSFNPLSLSYIKVYFEIDGKWVEQKTGWSATVSDSGGIVTFLEAPKTRVSIERDVPESQPTSYTTSSGFQASVIEHSFDLLTGMVQELKDASDRSVKVEIGDNQTPEELLQTVYDKLDSATEIAGDAISAANQAQTAADNATESVKQAEQTLVNVTAYVDSAKVDIDNTKNTAIETIDSTVAQAKADVNSAIDEATTDISNIVSDAEGSITNIAVTEANKAIANAAQEATDTATANVNNYVNGTILPPLQTYVDQAREDANSAATSMEQAALSATAASNYASNASADADNAAESAELAANSAAAAKVSENNAKASETNAKIWAEGTDAQVQALGGEKSAKGWAEASTNVNYTNITNCLTEIPQDINYYFAENKIYISAGTKVYIPAGFEEDGVTRKFETFVLQNTLTSTSIPHGLIAKNNELVMIAIASDISNYTGSHPIYFESITLNKLFSGDTAPENPRDNYIWYDTATNIIKRYTTTNNSWNEGTYGGTHKFALPLGTFEYDMTSGAVEKPVSYPFNGFGYIGNWGFVLPDVEVLIPNGRNSDGSLNNIKYKTQKVYARQIQYGTNTLYFWLNMNNSADSFFSHEFFIQENMPTSNARSEWYKPSDNKIYFKSDGSSTWTQYMGIPVFSNYGNDNGVTSFTPKTVFHAADSNDVVHKTGDEGIGGIKDFTGTVSLPASNTLIRQDNWANEGGELHLEVHDLNKSIIGNHVAIDVYDNQARFSNAGGSAGISIPLQVDFQNKCVLASPSSVKNSVITTAGIKKSANGYLKMGNGIIIQWGRYDYRSNSAGFRATITFPTAFTSTNYSFSLIGTRASNEDVTAAINCEGRAKTTTSIVMQCSRTSGSSAGIRYIDWIAIGY